MRGHGGWHTLGFSNAAVPCWDQHGSSAGMQGLGGMCSARLAHPRGPAVLVWHSSAQLIGAALLPPASVLGKLAFTDPERGCSLVSASFKPPAQTDVKRVLAGARFLSF